MEADWEVEIGGGAAAIEAEWSGFVDLRGHPERIAEIAETVAFAPLGALLLALNGADSPLWTSKCDVWEPEIGARACYVDLLPLEGMVFANWQQAEAFCKEYVASLARIAPPELGEECSVELVIRQAFAGEAEGVGITAYLSARAGQTCDAAGALAATMAVFADALPFALPAAKANSKLQ